MKGKVDRRLLIVLASLAVSVAAQVHVFLGR